MINTGRLNNYYNLRRGVQEM